MSAATHVGQGDLRVIAQRSHRRWNALTGEWVLVSPHRTQRPWQGQVADVPVLERPVYDPDCYLCPGNTRANGDVNPAYTETFAFDNDFAALSASRGDGRDVADVRIGDLLAAQAETGVCRVICFSPRHDLTLSGLSVGAVRGVVECWAEESERLGRRDDIGHVQIFENKGEMMGCSNPHPHGQIWAQRSVPLAALVEGGRMLAHYAQHGRTLLSDYLALESRLGERLVCENDSFIAVVPFWAVWPFETMVVSRRPVAHLGALRDDERAGFADIITRVTRRYDQLFLAPFPYSSGIHQAPTDGAAHPEWHLHMHFYPPLLRSATVRKFLVGYEMLAEPQRDLTPEAAAERLRALPETPLRSSTAEEMGS